MVLKKGSSYPKEEHVVMVRMIAIENIFRMSLMYLKKNIKALRAGMDDNPNQLDQEIVEKHRKTMNNIVRGMYPQGKNQLENFKQLELWLGHDLLVNGLAALGKTGGKHETRFRVFIKNIPEKDWKIYQQSEIDAGRDVPKRKVHYDDPPEKQNKKTAASMRTTSKTKRTKTRGK
jgi:hypothetical protein